MTFVVPFDGCELSKTALVRASEFSTVLEERVVAVSVVPKGNAKYAREQNWISEDENFDVEAVLSSLHTQITDLAPEVDFRHEFVDRYASAGTISNTVRAVARDVDVSIVFIGSENAGSMVSGVGSVGSSIAAGDGYDVHIVKTREPSKIDAVRNASRHQREKSDFYL